MANREKQLESRVATLERQLARIYQQLGLRDEEVLALEYDDAIEALAAGDRTRLDAYLKRLNNAQHNTRRGQICRQ